MAFSQRPGRSGADAFPDPFMDVASLNMPSSMRNALQWCLPPGTLVEREGGWLTPIERIEKGMRVLTRGGTIEDVVQTSVRNVDEDIVRLEFAGFGKMLPLRLTANHNVWRIGTPKLKPNRVVAQLNPAKAEKVRADEVRVGDYFATPLLRRDVPCAPTHPPKWPAGKARFSGWLTGMYAAEGCTIRIDYDRAIGVRFTLGKDDDVSGVLGRLLWDLELQTGGSQAAYTPPSRPDVRLVSAHDPELPDWLMDHVPGLAKTKRFAPHVVGYDNEFLFGLIGGMIDGDGWVVRVGDSFRGATVSSASPYMLRQLQRIAYLLDLTPSLCEVQNNEGSYGQPGSKAYQLSFDKVDCGRLADHSMKLQNARESMADFVASRSKSAATFVKDGYVFHRVTRVTKEAYKGPVHNFEVRNDHSYVANGLLIANCEYIYQSHGTYRMALERIVSYFMTDIEFGDGDDDSSDDEQDKWRTFMVETMDAPGQVQQSLNNRMAYGNEFCSLLVPFKRFLRCPTPGCGSAYLLNQIFNNNVFRFEWSNMKFTATCPQCKKRGAWHVDDKPDDEERKIKLKHWNVHEIEILHDYYTDDCAYLWRIPEDYKQQVRKGNLFHLERASMPVIEAIAKNQMFRFNDDVIYHMKEPTLCGVRNRGWGIPRTLSNFRQIYYVQVLRRYNEAIALDYVIPFRLLTPAPRGGGGGGGGAGAAQMMDPLMAFNAGDMRSQITSMVRRRRKDPAGWNVLPFPVQYQMLGGDANALAPVDLIANGTEQLLNDIGTPVELYKGTLQLQTAPVALRLFESTWQPLVRDANAMLSWIVRQVSQIMSWEVVNAKLKRVTIADDMQKMMMQLQLYMGQSLSGTTAFHGMGLDWKKEQKRMGDETIFQAESQAKVQETMDQTGFASEMAKGNVVPGQGGAPQQTAPGGAPQGGGGGGGGDPSQGGQAPPPLPVDQFLASMGPNVPIQPQEMLQAADTLAQQLLGLPEGTKNSQLKALGKKNEVMGAMVRDRMARIRDKAKQQGGDQMLQQQFGQGGGGQPPQQ